MTGAIGDVLPWPQADNDGALSEDEVSTENDASLKSNVRTSVLETTQGGTDKSPWIVVAVNLNPGEAVVIKGRLESEEIPAVIQQEAIGSFMGLTVGPLGSAKVLVPEPLAERALDILNDTFGDEEDIGWDDDDWVEDEN